MGGSAFLIWGTADIERFAKGGFFARFFGGGVPRETSIGANRYLTELPARSVQALVPEFKSYIRRKVGSPWPATKSILEYLDIAFRVYARGEREHDGPTRWYVQLSFGGCAGMAEISSEVAAHWAARWHAEERERIASILTPAGFSPSHHNDAHDDLTFLPVGEAGYAAFKKEGYSEGDVPPTHFDLDMAAVEGNEENAEALLRSLEASWVEFMSDGRCHCQFCDPRFEDGRLEELARPWRG